MPLCPPHKYSMLLKSYQSDNFEGSVNDRYGFFSESISASSLHFVSCSLEYDRITLSAQGLFSIKHQLYSISFCFHFHSEDRMQSKPVCKFTAQCAYFNKAIYPAIKQMQNDNIDYVQFESKIIKIQRHLHQNQVCDTNTLLQSQSQFI